jgi:hypothetical protein
MQNKDLIEEIKRHGLKESERQIFNMQVLMAHLQSIEDSYIAAEEVKTPPKTEPKATPLGAKSFN